MLGGCGNGNDYTFTGGSGGGPAEINDYVLREQVKILPSGSGLVIEQITDNTVTFSGNVPTFQIGEVLIQNTGDQQFGRKVLGVQSKNGKTVVTTGPISLVDVFASANIQRSALVPAEVLSRLEPAIPGVSVGEPFQAQTTDGHDSNFTIPLHFQNVLLGGKDDPGKLLANGTVYITLGLETSLRIEPIGQLKELKLVPYFKADGKLDLQAAGGTSFHKKVPISQELNIPLGGIGPLPLEGGVKLVIDAQGKVTARGKLVVDGAVEAGGGVAFQESEGWTTPHYISYNFAVEKPQLQGDAEVSLAVVNPEMKLNLVGIGDAYVDVAVMRAHAVLTFQAVPQPGFTFTPEASYGLSAGVNLNLGPINLFNGELPTFNSPRVPLGPSQFIPALDVDLPAASLTIAPGAKTLEAGEKVVLQAQAVFSGSPVGVPVPVEWSSSNPSAVSVSGNGPSATVTALKSSSTATIRATALGKSATADITVKQPGLTSITIEPAGARVMATSDLQLKVLGHYSDGSTFDLTHLANFATSDRFARVNSGGRVTGVEAGTASIKAEVAGLSATTQVEVFARTLSRLRLVHKPSSLKLNEKLDVLAIAYYLDGSHRFVERQVEWKSSNPAAVSVDAEGKITAVGPGKSTVSAVLPGTGLSDAFTVTVVRPPIKSLTLSPTGPKAVVGDTIDFKVTVTYTDGSTADVTNEVQIGEFWGDILKFDGTVAGRAVAQHRGAGLVIAALPEPESPWAVTTIEVNGPDKLHLVTAPTTVNAGASFALQAEALFPSGGRSTVDVPVSVRLSPDSTTLSGTLSARTVGGVVSFSGLSIGAPGDYNLVLESAGLQSAVVPIKVNSGIPNLLANLFVGTDGGLSVTRMLAGGALEQANNSPFSVGSSPAYDVARVGDFLYATDSAGNLHGFRFDQANQSVARVVGPLSQGAPSDYVLVTTDRAGVIYVKKESGGFIQSYKVDLSTGALDGSGTNSNVATVSGYTSSLIYDSGLLFDLNFADKKLSIFKTDSNGAMSLGETETVGGTDDYPAGLAVANDSLYLGIRTTTGTPSSKIVRYTLNSVDGTVSDSGQSWSSGVTGMFNGFVDGSVDIIAYQHPVVGKMLFVAHSSGAITRFSVAASGELSQLAGNGQVGSHPHRMLVQTTSEGDFLVVTTLNGLEVFRISSTDGTLSSVSGSPFAVGDPFGITH